MPSSASNAMPVKPSSVQEASSSGTSSPFKDVMANAAKPAGSSTGSQASSSTTPLLTSSKKEAGPEHASAQTTAQTVGGTPLLTSAKKEAGPQQASAQVAAQTPQQTAAQVAVVTPVLTSAKKEAAPQQTSNQEPAEKPASKTTEKKTVSDAGTVNTAATSQVAVNAVMATVVTAPMTEPPPALEDGLTAPSAKRIQADQTNAAVANEGATFEVAVAGTSAAAPKDAVAAEADKSVDAVVDAADADSAAASIAGTTSVSDNSSQVNQTAVEAGAKNDVAIALSVQVPLNVPFDVPMNSVQAAALTSAAATSTKLPASAVSREHEASTATAVPTAASSEASSTAPSVSSGIRSNVGASPALQAFQGIEQPAAGGGKPSGSPMTKIANGIAPKDGIGKQKEAEVASAGGPSIPTAAGNTASVDKSSAGGASTGGNPNFQDAVKAAAQDAVRETASAVSAIDNGAASNTPNEGGQPAMEQMAPATEAPAAQTGHETGGLFQAASTAAAAATAAANVHATAATPALSSAQLLQSMRGSEMRIGMHSEEFGKISINTSLTHKTLAAQISFDHAELGKALAVHVPAMQEKLGIAYGVQTRVEVRDGQTSFSGGSGQQGGGYYSGSGSQQRGQTTPIAATYGTGIAIANDAAVSQTAMYDSSARLDIRI